MSILQSFSFKWKDSLCFDFLGMIEGAGKKTQPLGTSSYFSQLKVFEGNAVAYIPDSGFSWIVPF